MSMQPYKIVIKYNHRIDSVESVANEVLRYLDILQLSYERVDTSEFNPRNAFEVFLEHKGETRQFFPFMPYEKKNLKDKIVELYEGEQQEFNFN